MWWITCRLAWYTNCHAECNALLAYQSEAEHADLTEDMQKTMMIIVKKETFETKDD